MGSLLWLFNTVISIAIWVIIIQAVMSWLIAFNVLNIHQQLVGMVWQTANRMTEPLYRPVRRFMPDLGGIDLTPMVVLIGLLFLQQIVNRNVYALM